MKWIERALVATTIILALWSCHSGTPSATMQELSRIDSMVYHQGEAEALSMLQQINTERFGQKERSYYTVLLSMAQYKNYVPCTSDSAINEAVSYFKQSGEDLYYLKALVAQGCVNEDMGNLDKAVDSYHHAEVLPLSTDSALIAYAKLRLGALYHDQYTGSETLSVQKYLEAMILYQALGDKHYEGVCAGCIGNIYRNIDEKHDSSVVLLNHSIELAKELNEPLQQLDGKFALLEYYMLKEEDYKTAIKYGLDGLSGIKAYSLGNDKEPRLQYHLAYCYLKSGRLDSALYYINTAPKPMTAVDSLVYFKTCSELEHYRNNDYKSLALYKQANAIGDSVLVAGLNHRLLAVEKKYDVQLAELNKVKYQSKLRGTLLALAAVIIAALALLLGLLRYRNRLKNMAIETEALKSDLDTSLLSLEQMQANISNYENELKAAQAELKGNENEIAALQEKLTNTDEIRTIVDEQIKIVHELIQSSYELDGTRFAQKFNELMTMPEAGSDNASYWDNLQQLVNDLFDNVLVKAQETAGGTLRDDEINYLALHCCGFSRTVIMICMKYKSLGTVSNKKVQIAHKLGVANLDDFVKPYKGPEAQPAE